MKKIISKFLISFLIIIGLIASFGPLNNVKAESQWYMSPWNEWYVKVYDETNDDIFGERYTAAQVQWVFYGFLSMVINLPITAICESPGPLVALFSGDAGKFQCPRLGLGASADGSSSLAVKPVSNNIFELVFADRALSGVGYIRSRLRDFKIIPEAHAQVAGFGYGALDPILPLWTVVRNVAYVFFVFVVLIMAFMIMFRVKISPQAAITVQSALPRIAIAMVLVTFSYAIAGFLIDLMYVSIGFISVVLGGLAGGNIGQIFTNMTNPQGGIIGVIVFYLVFTLLGFVSIVRGIFLSAGDPGTVTDPLAAAGVAGGVTLSSLLFAIIFIIIVIATLFIGFKLALMLLRAFVNIVLLTVLAPIQFALGAISSSLSFSSWVRNMVANLAVFPVVGLLFSLSFMFLASVILMYFPDEPYSQVYAMSSVLIGSSSSAPNTQGWPPIISLPGLSDQRPWIYLLMSIGIFFLIPKAADIIKSMLEGKPFGFGSAIGEAAMGAAGIAGLPIQQRLGQRQARENARLETDIRGYESVGDYGNAEIAREELARRQLNSQLRGSVFKQFRDSLK